MIIEIYGLPGSGKTTAAKRIADSCGYEIIKIRKKSELVFYNFLFLIKHPVRFFVLLYYVFRFSSSLKEFYFKLMNTFFDYNAKYQKALKKKNAILDQNYFTNIFAVFTKPVDAEVLTKYLKYVLCPDKLIIMNIDKDIREKRVMERNYFARDDFGDEYKKEWREAMEKNNKIFFDVVKKMKIDYLILDDDNLSSKII
ncbi:MAG: AAA family ATPase [bacterium]